MIKAVIFDVDGVLLDSFEANLKFFSDLMIYFGYNSPTREQFPELFHRSMKDIIRTLTKLTNENEIEKIWKAGRDDVVRYPVELAFQSKHVKKTLEILSKDYILGIVTSRTTNNIYRLPQLAELEKYFKVTIGYQDTEKHKPEPDPLLLAAKKLGVPTSECVYIGDSANDIIAATAAGMKSILFYKENLANADANVFSFQELPEIIKSI